MKCSILQPRNLYHPVLPFRCNKQLLFYLCQSCSIEQNRTGSCTHEKVAERALTRTWVLDEIRLAVKKGYKLVEVYEVYEYQVTEYNPQTGNGRLFVQFIDTFLKLTEEACGYPSWVQSPADEDRYISEIAASEGIQLDKDDIGYKPRKAGPSQIMPQFHWGKLTERNDITCTKMISYPLELYRFLATPGIDVATLMFASNDVFWASWRYIAEEVPNIRYTNQVIGAYVTAGARINLYGYLDRLQKRELYCDTYSVIYIQPTLKTPLVKTGECLGAMTSEQKPGCHIGEFVSGRPKNYAYRIVDPVTGYRKRYVKSEELR